MLLLMMMIVVLLCGFAYELPRGEINHARLIDDDDDDHCGPIDQYLCCNVQIKLEGRVNSTWTTDQSESVRRSLGH